MIKCLIVFGFLMLSSVLKIYNKSRQEIIRVNFRFVVVPLHLLNNIIKCCCTSWSCCSCCCSPDVTMYFSNLDNLYSYSTAVLSFACRTVLIYFAIQRLLIFLSLLVVLVIVIVVPFLPPFYLHRESLKLLVNKH